MGDRSLLLVDDEQAILNALGRLLRKEPYAVRTATTADEALDILQDDPTVQVVASDYRMPGTTGVELLREVKLRHPHTVRVVLSGYADGHVILDAINVGEVYRFLPKPWNDEELIVTLRQCFDQYRLLEENARLLDRVQSQNEELKEMNALLEAAVDHRTRSLELSQEILEKLPLPVLGISTDGTIALVNAAMARIRPEGTPPPLGRHIREVLPAGLVERVSAVLDGVNGRAADGSLDAQPYFWNGASYRMHIRLLNGGGPARGCTLILEAIHENDYGYSLHTDSAAC